MDKREDISAHGVLLSFFAVAVVCGSSAWCATSDYEITTASYIGGAGDDDRVTGCAVQSNGVVVLAANLTVVPATRNRDRSALPGLVDTPGGYLVRLSPDGTDVLSLHRLGNHASGGGRLFSGQHDTTEAGHRKRFARAAQYTFLHCVYLQAVGHSTYSSSSNIAWL